MPEKAEAALPTEAAEEEASCPQQFIECLRWDGPRDGYYFGTAPEGLGYHFDAHVKVVVPQEKAEAKSVVQATDQFAQSERKPRPAAGTQPLKVVSKKEAKRIAKMTLAQRTLLGYGDVTFEPSPDGNGMVVKPTAQDEKLDDEIEDEIKRQKRKAADDPTAKELYAYQKENPHLKDSNVQKQTIFAMYRGEQMKKRKIASQEEKRQTMYLRQNKPAWL